jgi:hypothetical protein
LDPENLLLHRQIFRHGPDDDQQNSGMVDEDDNDGSRVARPRPDPVVILDGISQRPAVASEEKHTFDSEHHYLLLNGRPCLPLVSTVLETYLPGRTLPSGSKPSALLKKLKRTLKRNKEEKLGVFADWGHLRSEITCMFKTNRIANTTAVYAVDALQRIVCPADDEHDP